MSLADAIPGLSKLSAARSQPKMPRLSGKFRIEIYSQLATFIEDGFTPFETAKVLAIEYGNESGGRPRDDRARVYRFIAKRLTQGHSMAQALKGAVPNTDLYVIEAAEKVGSLDEGFNRLIYLSEKSGELTKKVLQLFKPAGMVVFVFSILYGFATSVLPDFTTMIDQNEQGAATTSLIATGIFLENYIFLIVGIFAAYAIISYALLDRLSHPFRDRILSRYVPPFNFYQLFSANSFLLTLGTMMKSGIRLKDSLSMIKSLSGNYLSDHIEEMELRLTNGAKEGHALATDLFDDDSKRLLRVYGRTEQFEQKMQQIAQRSLEAALKRVDKIVAVAGLIIKILSAGVLVWIVMAIGGVIIPLIGNSI